jgi:hypothetical protein
VHAATGVSSDLKINHQIPRNCVGVSNHQPIIYSLWLVLIAREGKRDKIYRGSGGFQAGEEEEEPLSGVPERY